MFVARPFAPGTLHPRSNASTGASTTQFFFRAQHRTRFRLFRLASARVHFLVIHFTTKQYTFIARRLRCPQPRRRPIAGCARRVGAPRSARLCIPPRFHTHPRHSIHHCPYHTVFLLKCVALPTLVFIVCATLGPATCISKSTGPLTTWAHVHSMSTHAHYDRPCTFVAWPPQVTYLLIMPSSTFTRVLQHRG
jgi:hypothetical protein